MNSFDSALSRFAALWRLGLLLVAVLMTLAMGGLVLLLLGGFDFVAPLSDEVRPVVFMAWCSVLVLLALSHLLPLLRLNRARAAAHADETLGARRPVTTALEVSQQQAEATPLRQFLVDKLLWDGEREIEALSFFSMLPRRSIRRAALTSLAVLLVFAALCVANFAAVKTISARLLHPYADVPPYSPLQFEVTPARPKVVYGADAELEVRVTGGAVPEGVVLLTREDAGAPVSTAGAFAMGGGRFGQRLQRVTQPVQIAFAAGAARSPWLTVDVMRQPRVESVMLKIIPPAYSKRPAREFALGTSELVALAGSEVEARITSNRPLSGGEVTLTPPRSLSRDKPETVVARASGGREVTLRWKVKSPCLVRLDLKDITGASSAAPVELEQKMLPDNPPVVSLESPAGVTLATPESEVPLKIEVEDDLGLARIDLVRKLTGFRDRGRRLTEDAADQVYALDEKLEMKKLGVEPGQTLELHAEAHDHNPTLMGIASSSVGRIQVISTEDYAELMQARTTLKEFQARFSALNEAVQQVRESLDSGDRAAAQQAMQQAQELAEAMAKDFQAFDAEKQVAQEAQKIAQMMQGMQQRLAGGSKEEMEKMKQELGEAARRTQDLKDKGKQLAEIGRVLEMAAEFKSMHAQQQRLTKQLEELAREIMIGDMRNAAKLDKLARQQQAVLDRWKQWLPELRAAAEALPASEGELKKESLDFANAAESAGIQRSMETAMQQAKKDNTPNTFVNSQLALVGMDTLMNSDNKLCQSCKSGGIHFMTKEGLSETLAQMLAGMCKRRGMGKGEKPGQQPGQSPAGGDGDNGDGFSTEGDPMLNAPVYGPERMAFNDDSSMRGNHNSRGKSGQGQIVVTPQRADSISTEAVRAAAKRQISLRDVPERYREAVRKFYGEDAVLETSSSKEAKP
ncbi:hypothetical protein [Prosthecobacter fluviatilis]|uniref:Uncharacterized protein n=1 Tax=Prosthecobacter fluviatilis TaxID=445931 RepID=A0ABW0KT31_9BACT